MGFFELPLIAVGLSMDAFAVSLCKGLCMKKFNRLHAVITAASFGLFQAIMPLVGWLIGFKFEKLITSYDHWIAFGLLSLIGCKMIYDSFAEKDEPINCVMILDLKELFFLSVATSIDALAVGVTFAFLKVPILPSITLIGIITFVLCVVGVIVGNRFGIKYKNKAEMAGGLVLIFIGAKILLEHLGLL